MTTRHRWTATESRYLVATYADTDTDLIAGHLHMSRSQIYAQADKLGLKKSAEYIRRIRLAAAARASVKGIATRFKPGNATWNKGLHYNAGGRSAETRFKPGRLPNNFAPIGSERMTKDGYLQRKMTATGYPPRDWVMVHKLIWLAAGNTIPPGYALRFKDGDKTHLVIDNLELISRKELMHRNSHHRLGKEFAQTVQLRGAITRQINQRTARQHHD